MRDEREFEQALQAIAGGSSIRRSGVPKSTLLSRAQREPAFERRLAAALQTGRLHLRAAPHVAAGEELTRDELVQIVTEEARARKSWAVKLAFELLDSEPSGSVIPDRFLRALDR